MSDAPTGGPHRTDPPRGAGVGGSRADEQAERTGWYRMAGVGVEFIVAVALFGGIGWFLDGRLDTAPWLLLAGCGLGFAVGLWLLYKAARRSFR